MQQQNILVIFSHAIKSQINRRVTSKCAAKAYDAAECRNGGPVEVKCRNEMRMERESGGL